MYILTVDTFGKFRMEAEHIVIQDEKIRSVMLTKLLVYLLMYRGKPASTDELIDALYMEGEVDKPAGALKNLVYRLRTLLNKEFHRDDFIISGRGNYQWNPDVVVSIDTEKFEMLLEQAKNGTIDRWNTVALYEEALALYKGDFMSQLTDPQWIIPLSSYYRALFLSGVRELAKIYAEQESYERLEALCINALRIENADETIYYYLILARVKMGNRSLAMKSYEDALGMMTQTYGAGNYKRLNEIYNDLMGSNAKSDIAKIDEVADDLNEDEASGVFVCGYPVFKELYRLEQRKMMRHGGNECLLLLTLTAEGSLRENIKLFRIRNAMDKLIGILRKNLRLGDAVSKYNDRQVVVLLTSCDYEGSLAASQRIMEHFAKEPAIHESIKLSISSGELNEMLP